MSVVPDLTTQITQAAKARGNYQSRCVHARQHSTQHMLIGKNSHLALGQHSRAGAWRVSIEITASLRKYKEPRSSWRGYTLTRGPGLRSTVSS